MKKKKKRNKTPGERVNARDDDVVIIIDIALHKYYSHLYSRHYYFSTQMESVIVDHRHLHHRLASSLTSAEAKQQVSCLNEASVAVEVTSPPSIVDAVDGVHTDSLADSEIVESLDSQMGTDDCDDQSTS